MRCAVVKPYRYNRKIPSIPCIHANFFIHANPARRQNRRKPALPALDARPVARNKMPPRNSNLLRVAGGNARGMRLKGAVDASVRPTTQRVRAAIFNILEPGQVRGRRALDLYAGAGSLGIEALSHGAAYAAFVERNARQCRLLRDNLAQTGYAAIAQVHCADAQRWLTRASAPERAADPAPFHLALLDPPYRMPTALAETLRTLALSGALADGAIVVAGHSSRAAAPDELPRLDLYDRRQYGDNALAFYRYQAA